MMVLFSILERSRGQKKLVGVYYTYQARPANLQKDSKNCQEIILLVHTAIIHPF
jgi:hypothetical protein